MSKSNVPPRALKATGHPSRRAQVREAARRSRVPPPSVLTCNGVTATPTNPLPAVCLASRYSSSLVSIPAPGTGDNDHDPQRIAPRSLFDMSLGKTNVFNKEHYKTDLDFTAINVTNKYALYNFLSTFSGTHYVTPRAMTAKITVNF